MDYSSFEESMDINSHHTDSNDFSAFLEDNLSNTQLHINKYAAATGTSSRFSNTPTPLTSTWNTTQLSQILQESTTSADPSGLSELCCSDISDQSDHSNVSGESYVCESIFHDDEADTAILTTRDAPMLFERNVSNTSIEGLEMPVWAITERADDDDDLNETRPFVVSTDWDAPSLVFAASGSRESKPCVIVVPTGYMFYLDKIVKNSIYMRCQNGPYNRNGCQCPARLTLKNPDFIKYFKDRDNLSEVDRFKVFVLDPKDYKENKPPHYQNCHTNVGQPEKVKFLMECKRLAVLPRHNFSDAMTILREAKENVVPTITPLDNFPTDRNVCIMINRARAHLRPKAPKRMVVTY
ncbi:unnamed protein product [Meganyctiphanes norvegica]|uniref:Uncharacterized protein n=1 Tax=Meganyctiphanes norvegica TaxID=48144 RepID=A0AAV2PLT3_MEGNR